ncbi:MAG: cyclase family protein, partial [Rhodothermia bacterium]
MYRKRLQILFVAGAAILLTGCSEKQQQPLDFATGTWHDLSYDLSSETVYWPTAEPFKLDTVAYGETAAGFFYSAFSFQAAEHGGTHLDAPIHFSADRRSVDEIPLEDLVGPAVVIDVSARADRDKDYLVSVSDIQEWETVYGVIPSGAMVLLNTGHGSNWPDPKSYLGTEMRGPDAVPLLHFPGLDPATAQWFVDNRSIRGIGLDTPSIDYGQSQTFEAHQILAGENILIFENV